MFNSEDHDNASFGESEQGNRKKMRVERHVKGTRQGPQARLLKRKDTARFARKQTTSLVTEESCLTSVYRDSG
eukprot:scaffold203544_cov18-Prasinocladus_malaysianus.AAC.1